MSNSIVYYLETYNTDRAIPYVFCFYRLSKLAGRYNPDLTPDEIKKCKKDTIAFDGDNCVEKALGFCLKLKGEKFKDSKCKVLEYSLLILAHSGSGFDSWILLNNLPCDKRIVNIIKNGKGIMELKIFNGYIEKNEKFPQYLQFRYGMTHLNCSLKKLGKTFKLQKELIKTEMNHDEVDGNNYKDKQDEWLGYVKNDVLCTAFSYVRNNKCLEEITGFSMKDCLSLPGLGLNYFSSLRGDEDDCIYTYNDKYMRWFVRQVAYGGCVCAFNQYYKSKHCDDILKFISKELCVKGNVYDIIEVYMEYKDKHFKIFEKKFENQFNDFRDENVTEKEKYINERLSSLRLHKMIRKNRINSLTMGF